MKKNKMNLRRRKDAKKCHPHFPAGWNERKVRAVIRHYERLSDEELARAIESAPEVAEETLMSVPADLVPAVRKLIALHQKSA